MTGTSKMVKRKNTMGGGRGGCHLYHGQGECINECGGIRGNRRCIWAGRSFYLSSCLFFAGGIWGCHTAHLFSILHVLLPWTSGCHFRLTESDTYFRHRHGDEEGGLFNGGFSLDFCDTPVFIHPSLFRFSCFVSYQSSLFLRLGLGTCSLSWTLGFCLGWGVIVDIFSQSALISTVPSRVAFTRVVSNSFLDLVSVWSLGASWCWSTATSVP